MRKKMVSSQVTAIAKWDGQHEGLNTEAQEPRSQFKSVQRPQSESGEQVSCEAQVRVNPNNESHKTRASRDHQEVSMMTKKTKQAARAGRSKGKQ